MSPRYPSRYTVTRSDVGKVLETDGAMHALRIASIHARTPGAVVFVSDLVAGTSYEVKPPAEEEES